MSLQPGGLAVKKVAAAALALVTVVGVPAALAEARPTGHPVATASAVTSTVAGPLPQSSLSAAWNYWRGGTAATLEVSGYGMSGTTSTAVGSWTSAPTAVSGSKLFATVTHVDERSGVTGAPGTWSAVVRIRHRDVKGAWSRWLTLGDGDVGDGLVTVSGGSQGWDVSYTRATRAPQQLQVEASYRVSDTSSNDLFTTVVVP